MVPTTNTYEGMQKWHGCLQGDHKMNRLPFQLGTPVAALAAPAGGTLFRLDL
jgi:hypothetical protein